MRRRERGSGWDWGKFSSAVTALTALAALLFTGLSLQQSRAQNQLAESGQITDRFNAAVTNLGSATETIRIGGIYALQRIMQDSPRDQPAAVRVLNAFVRERTAPASGTPSFSDGPAATDVLTALEVLEARDLTRDQDAAVALARANLTGANLNNGDLSHADFYDTNLAGTNLFQAFLYDANLTEAGLTSTNLTEADLTSADLYGAKIADANLTRAKLIGANLTRADLHGADLTDANLAHADLYGANLTAARLAGAIFSGQPWCDAVGRPAKSGGYHCLPPNSIAVTTE